MEKYTVGCFAKGSGLLGIGPASSTRPDYPSLSKIHDILATTVVAPASPATF
jgi:hypothetical protein